MKKGRREKKKKKKEKPRRNVRISMIFGMDLLIFVWKL